MSNLPPNTSNPTKKFLEISRFQVGEYKKRCRTEPGLTQLMAGCAPELRQILQIVDSLKYYDTPPYNHIYSLMRQSFLSTNTQEFPYDWEKQVPRFH